MRPPDAQRRPAWEPSGEQKTELGGEVGPNDNSPARLCWSAIVAEGAAIVRSYSTPVTLRQLHYRLVAASIGGYTNSVGCYKALSSRTAELRRTGRFPALADNGRSVVKPYSYESAGEALAVAARSYRLDRTLGQPCQVWVLFEKATLQAQFEMWTRPRGLPMAALRGYSSESLEREVFDQIDDDGRPVVVFYVGDLDPEGEDIERNFRDQATRAGIGFKHWERLAVTPEQVAALGLVPNPGKDTSSRAAAFIRRHGELFQIETEAVDPAELRRLIDGAINGDFFDDEAFTEVLARETREKAVLLDFAETFGGER